MFRRNLGGLAVLLAGAALLTVVLIYRLGLWPEPADVAELRAGLTRVARTNESRTNETD
jgi:hypothetical protein